MGSDGLVRIGRGDAERLIATFLPMIDWLDAHGVDYCLVGGHKATIGLLHADALQTARPQDFVDATRLRAIIDGLGGERRFP